MARTHLKRRRQELDLTQSEVAKALGVSQPTYQNYEADTLPLSETVIQGLMKVLKLTREEVQGGSGTRVEEALGRKLPKDWYWGEATIHFERGEPLVLSISCGEYSRLFRQLQDESDFFHVFSRANQMVAVRRAAVTDIVLADDASDTFGPEHESYPEWGIRQGHLPAGFWRIATDLLDDENSRAVLEEQYGKEEVTQVARDMGLDMPDDIDGLIAAGNIEASERESVLQECRQLRDTAELLTRRVSWQLSVGKVRRVDCWEPSELSRFWWIADACDPDAQGAMIIVEDPDAQTCFIRPDALDYIAIPQQLYLRGRKEKETTRKTRVASGKGRRGT